MKLVTIQNKKALNTLRKNQTFISDFEYIMKSPFDILSEKEEIEEANKIKTYQILMSHYGLIAPPIFCSIVDKRVNFEGTTQYYPYNTLLELEVPDMFVKLHIFNKWIEIQKIIKYSYWTAGIYGLFKEYLDGKDTNTDVAVQAILPFILPNWLIGAYQVSDEFPIWYQDKVLYTKNYSWYPVYKKK